MMTAIDVKQSQEHKRAELEKAQALASSSGEADKAADATLGHDTERLSKARDEVAKFEASLAQIDPDEPAWKKTREKLNEWRDRTTSLQNRVAIAEARRKETAETLKAAKQVLVEAKAEMAFSKYEEVVVELRELLATISGQVTAKLDNLKAAKDEFDATAFIPAVLYQRPREALAPKAIENSSPGLDLAGFLVTVAKEMLTNQKDAEESILSYETDLARRRDEQSPASQAEAARLLSLRSETETTVHVLAVRGELDVPVSKAIPEDQAAYLARATRGRQ